MPFGAGASVGVAFPVPLFALRVLIMAIYDRLHGAVVCHFRGGPHDVPKFLRFPPLNPPSPLSPLRLPWLVFYHPPPASPSLYFLLVSDQDPWGSACVLCGPLFSA